MDEQVSIPGIVGTHAEMVEAMQHLREAVGRALALSERELQSFTHQQIADLLGCMLAQCQAEGRNLRGELAAEGFDIERWLRG